MGVAQTNMVAMRDRYTERQGGDAWLSRGANQQWVRQHGAPRRPLFTPCRVARGPRHADKLAGLRMPEGVDMNGTHFKTEDDYELASCATCLGQAPPLSRREQQRGLMSMIPWGRPDMS